MAVYRGFHCKTVCIIKFLKYKYSGKPLFYTTSTFNSRGKPRERADSEPELQTESNNSNPAAGVTHSRKTVKDERILQELLLTLRNVQRN